MAAVLHVGCERPGRTPAQLEVQPQIANDFLREQADQVRVARQIRVVVGEHFLRGRRSADVIVLLQEQDTQSRAGQVGRRHQAIMSGAQDDDIVFGSHFQIAESSDRLLRRKLRRGKPAFAGGTAPGGGRRLLCWHGGAVHWPISEKRSCLDARFACNLSLQAPVSKNAGNAQIFFQLRSCKPHV